MEYQNSEPVNWKKLDRRERRKLIFENQGIKQVPIGWRVKSQSYDGREYLVKFRKEPNCTCPDCEIGHKKCKHIHAVEFYIKQEIERITKEIIEVNKQRENIKDRLRKLSEKLK